uniref:Uncharacterized protein n=1 Tax=Nelumbo nucifera TaxID=4432 RepID=A0A822XY41_NELNU|nr:TPA_asm: hypothetical protein HUJ06_026691 [Nelumbo nucifera]
MLLLWTHCPAVHCGAVIGSSTHRPAARNTHRRQRTARTTRQQHAPHDSSTARRAHRPAAAVGRGPHDSSSGWARTYLTTSALPANSPPGQGYIWMIHKTPGSDIWELAMRSKQLWEVLADSIQHQGMSPLEILGWKKTGSFSSLKGFH